ncbi:LysR family transcriptional regulator [uncultured Roseibium sp.]|uniref:LysR family transcriptional regulator n=1 Tax=uncultured Roseibium sp. TaxID=1936171 RepID=UPI0026279A0B|nr:LysR family transcriptional regulator [uncultured Roseibium sp.]
MDMSKIDFHNLDGQILRTFLVILEESSVSRAAERLEVTQSAVSHTLAKLRQILGDPLFVRSGQGLTPTETALSLKGPVLDVLDGLKSLTEQRPFDPKSEKMYFVVAANDMQRDLIFPPLVRRFQENGVSLSLEFKPSGVPSVSLLRDARCDMILTPIPPDAPDMIQHKLFSGEMKCFFDGACREAPISIEDYLAAQHVTVQFVLGGGSNDVLRAPDLPYVPKPTITVSNFSGITPFVRGTSMLATELEFMHLASLKELDMAPLPFSAEPLNIYMVWHERSTNDPAHKWLRSAVIDSASELVL